MFWKPAKTFGLVIGLFILLTIGGVEAFLLRSILAQDPGLSAYITGLLPVLSVPLLGLWIYWYYGLATMRYYLDRNALVVACGATRHIIPLTAIQSIRPGADVALSEAFHGIGWPGCLMGAARTREGAEMVVCSTEPMDRQLIVVTEDRCYGISPAQTERFLEEWAAQQALGPVRRVQHETAHLPFAALPVWRDRAFWAALLVGLVASVALSGIISGRYGALPDRIALHLNPQQAAFRIVAKADMYLFPAIGILMALANGAAGIVVHRRERLAAHLLAATSVGLQAPLWIVTLSVLGAG